MGSASMVPQADEAKKSKHVFTGSIGASPLFSHDFLLLLWFLSRSRSDTKAAPRGHFPGWRETSRGQGTFYLGRGRLSFQGLICNNQKKNPFWHACHNNNRIDHCDDNNGTVNSKLPGHQPRQRSATSPFALCLVSAGKKPLALPPGRPPGSSPAPRPQGGEAGRGSCFSQSPAQPLLLLGAGWDSEVAFSLQICNFHPV